MNEKLNAAKEYLGTKWVLHPNSTFDVKILRSHYACALLQIYNEAVMAGRL